MMMEYRFYFGRRLRLALPTIAAVAVVALVSVLCSAAFGANPAEEMSKAGAAGGIDPKGNSWMSIQQSLEQFAHPSFILRLFLSLTLAVGCAFAIAWHPRRASLRDPLADFEERKALVLLGVVGAVVAELSGTSQTLAFVIFGIGALLRFRTLLDNPKLTGKAIMVVVVGLACGMGSWAMAVFVTAFSWLLMFWLDSHSSCRVRIRLDDSEDPKPVFDTVQSLLLSHRCRLQSSSLYEDKGRMVFLLYIPSGVDPGRLEAEVRSKLKKNHVAKIAVDVV
ncbi:MAG: hypothetical protein DME20_11690 [Verrucomicrobia bacterium]|nr:MAG: hypothetical protein DME20_11690 [Verrucomicrobiota bacterium]